MPPQPPPTEWKTGSIDIRGLQTKLQSYVIVRSKYNDPSLPLLQDLINAIIANLQSLQTQINTGATVVNLHTFWGL
jgi:hypothetical protein